MFDPLPSVLDKAEREDIVAFPFPHIVIENAWPEDLYHRLVATRPPFERIAWSGSVPSNRRFPYSARRILDDAETDPIWPAFCRRHTGPDTLERVMALFGPHLDRWHPGLAEWRARRRPRRMGLLDSDGFERCDVLTDARLEINTPVLERPSSVRGPHLDVPNRLFSGLFYLRAGDDDTPGGELQLFRFHDGRPSHLTAYSIPEERVEAVRTLPYRANTLVLFANSPHAVHGVTPRYPSPHTRSYIFLTAEIEHDLFGSPAQLEDHGHISI